MATNLSDFWMALGYQSGGQVQLTPFQKTLMAVENAQRTGFDPRKNLWFPHESPEGGLPTIGYGHKLRPNEDFSKGLTDQEVTNLFINNYNTHSKIAAKGFGEKEYNELPDKYKGVLINIAFNTGHFNKTKWPNLVKAMKKGDDKAVRKEMITTFINPKTKKREKLLTRAKTIADVLELD